MTPFQLDPGLWRRGTENRKRAFRASTLVAPRPRVLGTFLEHIPYIVVPLTRARKFPKIFHALEALPHPSMLMPNTVETQIEEILESIRPALKADGGDVEFVRFNEEGGVVELRLLGACEDCPISMMTLKEGIEQRLKSGIPSITEVQAL